jgi:hypothetical protein
MYEGSPSVTETPITTSPTAPVFPPGRYGRRRDGRGVSRQRIAAIAAAVVLAGGFIAVRLFNAYGDGDYTAAVTKFVIADDGVAVTLMVRLPDDGAAICVVRARDATGAETGREEIRVVAGAEPERTMVTHRLATKNRPVTGEVKGCRPA